MHSIFPFLALSSLLPPAPNTPKYAPPLCTAFSLSSPSPPFSLPHQIHQSMHPHYAQHFPFPRPLLPSPSRTKYTKVCTPTMHSIFPFLAPSSLLPPAPNTPKYAPPLCTAFSLSS